ncbi:MAG: DUF2959 domain-containing protein [Nitrospiraceae bacterium]|nr:DUF2959 domain-containing protein [Nitrospiraceae bacterium]
MPQADEAGDDEHDEAELGVADVGDEGLAGGGGAFDIRLDRQFGQVVAYEGGDLEATYKKLHGELETSEDSAKAVRKRIADVESVADALFSEWERELGQYSSADLRRKSQAKLTQTRSRYKEMLGAMKRAEQRIEPVLKPLRDQVLYLKHNLNARALSAIKGELVKVDAQVDQLVKDMNRSIAEADKFIQSMEKESD